MSAATATAEEESLVLLSLPPDVLLSIFSYCDVKSLGILCQVCRHFNNIAKQECLWVRRARQALVTNQMADRIKDRSHQVLTSKEKCRISFYWKRAIYLEESFLRFSVKYMPWLQLHSRKLMISKGKSIYCFRRTNLGGFNQKCCLVLRGFRDDLTRFACHERHVVGGTRDGSICHWSDYNSQPIFVKKQCHASDVNCVDFKDTIVISGSRDKSVQIWSLQNNSLTSRANLQVNDRVWSVSLAPNKSTFAVGSAGYFNIQSFQVYDSERISSLQLVDKNFRNGAGILDIRYETPFVLLACGYDTTIRMWDLRRGSCVAEWEDPHDSVVYCLASDENFSILSGTALHGLVRLWDKRATKSVQMYYVGHGNSPVYSVAFDPSNMYVALDNSINILNFSSPPFQKRILR